MTRTTLSSAFRAPASRIAVASRSAPLEFIPVLRAEHGLSVPRSSASAALLTPEGKLNAARCLVERAMNILASAWKTVETTPFPVTARIDADSGVVAAPPHGSATSSHDMPPPHPTKISAHDGSHYPYQSTAEHMPLKQFIHEVLRRSRTSFITLQTALCYVEAIAAKLPTLIKEESEYMRYRADPSYDENKSSVPALPSPLLCPRRTFLASILLASKFLQDRSYSNKAWAKLTGLAPREVGRCERALFAALQWRLWVGKGSGGAQPIEGLDMVPVVAIDAVFQPEAEAAAPIALLQTSGSDAAPSYAAPAVSPRRRSAAIAVLPSVAVVEEVQGAGPSRWTDELLAPPSPTGTDLQSLTASQPDIYPDYGSSSSLSPDALSYTQSSSGSSYSEVGTPPDDMLSGPHGHESLSTAANKLANHFIPDYEYTPIGPDIVGGPGWS